MPASIHVHPRKLLHIFTQTSSDFVFECDNIRACSDVVYKKHHTPWRYTASIKGASPSLRRDHHPPHSSLLSL